jgi:glyoxylase-like metal-dependent hydrolase (beta-lactamase superfamily II)
MRKSRLDAGEDEKMPAITYGEAVAVSPRVRRITARNPGRMTGPGTNTYVVGQEALALIDPGPLVDEHIEAIVRLFGERLKWILVTHTHRDHSPAARPLAERTGAQLVGNVIPDDGYQDTSFTGARAVAQDECIRTPEFTLRAVLTPGHVSNHVCWLVEEDGLLMTGDHIMGGSTVVIVPPAGDMQAYIASLTRMLDYPLRHIAPGHGDLIEEPAAEIRHLIAHRLKREAKVVTALARLGRASIEALTPAVYDDVDPAMHGWAALSLHAHLIKLERDGRARVQGDEWALLPDARQKDSEKLIEPNL